MSTKHNYYKISGFVLLTMIAAELISQFIGFGDPPLVELDEQIEYVLLPDKHYSRFNNTININSYRMRSDDFNIIKQQREHRIMLLGDSVVYGNHHISQEDTIASHLKSELETLYAQDPVVIGSIAASSWGPENILQYVNKYGIYDSDYNVLILSSHDAYDVPFMTNSIIPYRTHKPKSALHDLLLAIGERIKRNIVTPREIRLEEKIQSTTRSLNTLLDHLTLNSEKTIIIFHRRADELTHKDSVELDIFNTIARSHNVQVLDTFELYNRSKNIHSDDIHLTSTGSEILSTFLAKQIQYYGQIK